MMKKALFLLFIVPVLASGQVGINTTNPHPSSILDMNSTTSGVLVPRMTAAEKLAITTPATGLLVYQTDSPIGFFYYDGTSWVQISTGSSAMGEFQSISGLVQNTTAIGSDDFVFGDTDLEGAGSKFFLDTSKGAFRAGQSSGNEWDDANVGNGSAVLGYGTASGDGAVAFNYGNASGANAFAAIGGSASGIESVALQSSTASGNLSFSGGGVSTAGGDNSFAFGSNNTIDASAVGGKTIGTSNSVTGQQASAFGDNLTASGFASFAAGTSAVASGDGAVAFNYGNASGANAFAAIGGSASGIESVALQSSTASGSLSFSGGGLSTASGDNSFAFGSSASANGDHSIALGNDVTALSYNETVFGFNSETYTPASTIMSNANDRLFVVGNGNAATGIPSTNNAFTLLKDGRTGIMRIPATNILEIEGNASKTSAGDWLANSDARLKKNIITFSEEKALEKLLALRGVTYEWNDNQTGSQRPEGTQYGFIAQEIQEVFPENVEKDNLGFYQTAYGTYDALYVQSIKALHQKIETLEQENTDLKNKIDEIHAMLTKNQSNYKK